MRLFAGVALTFVVLVSAGCGGGQATTAGSSLPVLARSAVSIPVVSTQAVRPSDLASDLAGGRRFERRLASWGFVRGRERDFQGPSRKIDRVVSRTLEFRGGTGAQAYVGYLAAHASALFGPGSRATALASRGRSGYLLDAAACACHRASPTLVAVLAGGSRVTWLEANGGTVKPATIQSLVDLAP